MQRTPIKDIPLILDTLRGTFRTGTTRPLAWRRHQLLQLARMVQENAEPLAQSLVADLGRPRMESYYSEIGVIVERAIICADKLEEWTKPEPVVVPDWQKSWNPTINKTPKGVVLAFSPWNFPLILSLQPLYGAMAAGCCAVIKPSESCVTFSNLLTELAPKYLDQSAYRIVPGAVAESTKLLELKWDHIFYTGNGRIARVVAAAAAKHLTPTTLELGGKSPVIVDAACDLDLAAKRILWGKHVNAGQICMSPDYVLIPRERQDAFVEALKRQYQDFYPDGALNSDSYGRAISEAHFTNVQNLLKRTKGKVALGGGTDGKKGMEPTIVTDVAMDDALMEGEIFGPVLPVIPVESVEDAVAKVNSVDHALVVYAFSDDAQTKQYILENTTSGNVAFNDVFQQISVNELPFGGVGESGHGRQVLRYSFNNFTYMRSTVDIPKEAEDMLAARYPPYSEEKFNMLAGSARLKIPLK